ncbi:hypothetical protein G7Z17_g12492 [Cylindrodendrum hubeiense]|uniref:MYND-type domain-containing protein n=1 Tax=Cylindrodendrum hubeiense TaxID=595255 RepID=A0A9P5GXK9_9HYPO|nr:hypothetical protein G7Z17_g12492 [Cylindrodendrum hubeiense]
MTPTPRLYTTQSASEVPPCTHPSCGRVPVVENVDHRCPACHVSYCSHGCRRSDSRRHKRICEQLRQGVEPPENWEPVMPCNEPMCSKWSPPKGLDAPISIPFTRLSLGTWLHDRPEHDVYRILIDTYRLRMDDLFTTTGKAEEDRVYNGKPTSYPGFRRFISMAAATGRFLPPWWDGERATKCEKLGLPTNGLAGYKLSNKINEEVVAGRYGDATFATQLRIFAASICGSYLQGIAGANTLREMAYSESVANRFLVA